QRRWALPDHGNAGGAEPADLPELPRALPEHTGFLGGGPGPAGQRGVSFQECPGPARPNQRPDGFCPGTHLRRSWRTDLEAPAVLPQHGPTPRCGLAELLCWWTCSRRKGEPTLAFEQHLLLWERHSRVPF